MKFNDLVKICESGNDSQLLSKTKKNFYIVKSTNPAHPSKRLLKNYSAITADVYVDSDMFANREDGPAVTHYYLSNNSTKRAHKETEEWFKHGSLHRVDGPAYTTYYDFVNMIYSKSYYLNGKHHRLDGPAFIMYNERGDVIDEEYYINDTMHTKEEFDSITKNVDKENRDDVTAIDELF